MKRVMHINPGARLARDVCQCMERGRPWQLEGKWYNILPDFHIVKESGCAKITLEEIVIKG